jgi:peptide/nickel transport system substrate-binding protein
VFDEGVLDDWFCCWPKHLLEKLDPKQIKAWDFWKRPVGCGPYRHVGTAPATMMEFEASSDYVFGKPKIERVILKFGASDASVPELLSGNVDAVCGSRRSDISNISRNRRFLVHQNWPEPGLAIYWNVRRPFFQDAAVRRALTYAINRRELLQVLNLPADARPIDFLPTYRQARRGDFTALNPYDPDLAGHLLDQAGWGWGRKGLRERGGKAFRFKALCSALPESLPSAVYVQDQLKRVGIQMDIVTVSDFGTIFSRFESGEFEAIIKDCYDGDLEMDLRRTGYDNPSFFGLLDKTRSIFDPEEKERVHGELARIFSADIPLTFLSPLTYTTIANRRIRGLEGSPYRGDLTQCMGELWLEDQV